ncbi:glutaredoxin-3-like [Apostichopus japonicus]|uniref:glutaredoxin-3-like n=1 Tax=Stichopus japonicus TaxID=307972 RepID=UPI003AB53D32
MDRVVEAKSVDAFDDFAQKSGSGLLLAYFWTSWADQCKQMTQVVNELAKESPQVLFVTVEAESVPEISLRYEITAVPTFIFIKNKQVIDRLDGVKVPELTKKVRHHADMNASPPPMPVSQTPHKEDINTRLKKLISASSCMLFMKGSPQEPKCGFSKQIVEILNSKNIDYATFDILEDNEVRQGLKKYSDWPTFPQLYHDGELLGGLDIVKEMNEADEIEGTLPKKQSLDERLKTLINTAPVMLFMKGSPDEPKCGFSRTICGILEDAGIKYNSFDILEDNDVRQGLKKFSNWPTFPQLYAKGELIGGLDIVKELQESGELMNMISD